MGAKAPELRSRAAFGSNLGAVGQGQSVFDIHSEVAHCALDLCVSEQDLNGTQLANLLVDDRRFRAAERMCAVVLPPEFDPDDLLVDKPCVLAGAHMPGVINPDWDDEVVERSAATLEPSQDAAPCRIEKLKLNRTASLLLDNNRAIMNSATYDKVADLDLHDVATAQLTVGRQIEHGAITRLTFSLKPEANGPNLLRLQGSLRAELPSGVPWALTLDARIKF